MIEANVNELASKIELKGSQIEILSDIVRLNEALCEGVCKEYNLTKDDYLELVGYRAQCNTCIILKPDKITAELREEIQRILKDHPGEIQVF